MEYICKSLYLHKLVYLYKKILDKPNITYIIKEIKQKRFGKLDILILQNEKVENNPKTMIFINKIKKTVAITLYSYFLPSVHIYQKDQYII